MQAAAAGEITSERLDDPVRRRRGRYVAALRGDRLAGRHRRRAAQAELRDLPGRRPASLTCGGVAIPFEDGHTRQLPVLTAAPFRYATHAWEYLDGARRHTDAQLKQAVISASAISLMYPGDGIAGYPREAFIEDLVREAASEMRGCLDRGAIVQIDFTEARLSLKLDPSGGLLGAFVDLNNRVLEGLTDEERSRVGVHSCPGGDQDRPTAPTSTTRSSCRRCAG